MTNRSVSHAVLGLLTLITLATPHNACAQETTSGTIAMTGSGSAGYGDRVCSFSTNATANVTANFAAMTLTVSISANYTVQPNPYGCVSYTATWSGIVIPLSQSGNSFSGTVTSSFACGTCASGEQSLQVSTQLVNETSSSGPSTLNVTLSFAAQYQLYDPTLGAGFNDNSASGVGTLVGGTYSIVIPGAPFSATPSVTACGKLQASSTPITVQAMFVNSGTNTTATGGTLTLSLAEQANSGGHPHLDRPVGTLSTNSGTSPLSATYTPGEASGTINLTVRGTAPDGSAPTPATTAINIGGAGSPFVPLSGVAFSIASHPEGTYGTAGMEEAVSDMAANYPLLAEQAGDSNPTPLRSEAASLPLGGIFDIDLTWTQPHCGHRDGQTIDLSLSNTTAVEKNAMKVAANDAGLAFYYVPESPSNPSANHWHATLTQ
jgi:hypothetical protein